MRYTHNSDGDWSQVLIADIWTSLISNELLFELLNLGLFSDDMNSKIGMFLEKCKVNKIVHIAECENGIQIAIAIESLIKVHMGEA